MFSSSVLLLPQGDGTTDCCLVKYKPSAGASGAASVVGAHGNSYLGAVDVKHAVLSMLPEEVLGRVPEQCTEQLMVSALPTAVGPARA